jgi:hypothetical protein
MAGNRLDVQADRESGLHKNQWDSFKDDEKAERYILRLANLLTHFHAHHRRVPEQVCLT